MVEVLTENPSTDTFTKARVLGLSENSPTDFFTKARVLAQGYQLSVWMK